MTQPPTTLFVGDLIGWGEKRSFAKGCGRGTVGWHWHNQPHRSLAHEVGLRCLFQLFWYQPAFVLRESQFKHSYEEIGSWLDLCYDTESLNKKWEANMEILSDVMYLALADVSVCLSYSWGVVRPNALTRWGCPVQEGPRRRRGPGWNYRMWRKGVWNLFYI